MVQNFDTILRLLSEKFKGLDLTPAKGEIEGDLRKPLTAAIFGQTGSGKSSLANAIFGTNFDVDDVKPCTKEAQKHHDRDASGNEIIFWDLPGIGESAVSDKSYVDLYTIFAKDCDVILWAFQADTRTITYDLSALDVIVSNLSETEKTKFLSRLTVVLTKANSISASPWIIAKNGDMAIIAETPATTQVLDGKSEYFYEGLIGKHQDNIEHRVVLRSDRHFLRDLGSEFWLDKDQNFLHHRGILDQTKYASLVNKHPDARDELSRLREQCSAVCCSARYRFNLNAVRSAIAQKGYGASILRIGRTFITQDTSLEWKSVKSIGLPVIFDHLNEKVIFDAQGL